jgi:hypothetical protein
LESNENIPMNWQQQRDIVMELLKAANPELMAIIAHPDNLPFVRRALGLVDLYVPGEDERTAEYDEIAQLLQSKPMIVPQINEMTGLPEEVEQSTVEIDIDLDNHQLRFDIDKKWLISPVGRQAKEDNINGYRNVLVHALAHKKEFEMQQIQQQELIAAGGEMGAAGAQGGKGGEGSAPPKKPNENNAFNAEPPIEGEGDVQTIQ